MATFLEAEEHMKNGGKGVIELEEGDEKYKEEWIIKGKSFKKGIGKGEYAFRMITPEHKQGEWELIPFYTEEQKKAIEEFVYKFHECLSLQKDQIRIVVIDILQRLSEL